LHADEAASGVTDYAPGSTGRITAPLARIVDEAKIRGTVLRQTLRPRAAPDGAFGEVDFDGLRRRALADPRVRALLGVTAAAESTTETQNLRYEGATVFLLASFSMPKPSLRQMMAEARAFGVPVIFRGFVNNSVYDTQAALAETFGALDAAEGFSIDPTLFARFQVTSVPQVIAVGATIDVCDTPGCSDDPVPPHDRVAGNVPLEFALHLIAGQGKVGHETALRLLRERERAHAD
jgi:conjugal transfer pilus assembly protein TrbC